MGFDFVGFSADQHIGIGNTGFCRKVIHLVIEQKSGPLYYDAGAITEIYGVGVGHSVAKFVGNRKMGGLIAFKVH